MPCFFYTDCLAQDSGFNLPITARKVQLASKAGERVHQSGWPKGCKGPAVCDRARGLWLSRQVGVGGRPFVARDTYLILMALR
jgi:hypothetical protein